MNTLRPRRFALWLLLCLPVWAAAAQPRDAAPPVSEAASPAASAPVDSTVRPDSQEDSDRENRGDQQDQEDGKRSDWADHGHWRNQSRIHHHGRELVNIGRNSDVPAGEHADSVVSVFGSSSVEGDARDVVSILGSTRVTGPVKERAVAVFGNTYVDSAVDGDVVAVLGNVELGPNAAVGGDVVAVGGTVKRDPASSVRGDVQSVGPGAADFGWLQPWIQHCLLYGRPLALAPGLDWAWGLALTLLALYAGLALLFREGVTRCVQTLETQPGRTLLAALLTMLLVPVLLVLLCVTVVGIAAVPFVGVGLLCASLFGKAVMLAWLGRRCVGAPSTGALSHPALAVLIGGVIVLALYLIPVIGFIVYKLLGLFGLGAVIYTLILNARAWRDAKANGRPGSAPAGASPVGPSPVGPSPIAPSPTPAAPAAATSTLGAGTASTPGVTTEAMAASGAAASGTAASGPAPAAAIGGGPAPASAAEPIVTAALPRAGFWIRMVALLLDALLVGVVMHVLHHIFHAELLMLAIYGAVMWKLRGSTIGGIVFDLRVVRLDGRPIDWETAIVRALGCFLSLAVAGLGFFWIAFDDGKQAWHDKIAGTAVVRVPKGMPLV